MKPARSQRLALAHIALLACLVLTLYWPGLSGGFIFDDFPNLVLDPDWKISGSSAGEFWHALVHGIASPTGRPLALASFAFNHVLSGMDPFWLKFTGLLIHLVNGVLVWLVCRKLFTHLWPQGEPSRPGAWAAFIVAAAWSLHPLQVSSVLYVVQRMELGAATGILLALLAYIRARQAQMAGSRGWTWLALAALATLFGLGFKETALLVPGFALVIEVCILRFQHAGGGTSRAWLTFYGLVLLAAVGVFFTVALPMSGPESGYAFREFTRTERLVTQLPVLALYLQQILIPVPESMTFYYDDFPVSRSLMSPATAMAAGLLVLLLALACVAWRRWPLVTLGILWFFVAHALTSNVLPLELVFEHRNYLALLGVLLALILPVHALALRLNKDARATVAVLPVLGLGALCWIQASTWGDPMRLAWALENRNQDSSRAVYGLGKELLLNSQDPSSPTWSMARAQFLRAAELSSGSALPLQGVLLMDGRQQRAIPDDLWVEFRDTLTRQSIGFEDLGALYAVVDCQIQKKCRFDDRQLLATLLAVIARNPGSPEVHTIYANYAWNVLGDRKLAVALQREAVRLSPSYPAFRIALAKFLLASEGPESLAEGRELAESLREAGHEMAEAHPERRPGTLE